MSSSLSRSHSKRSLHRKRPSLSDYQTKAITKHYQLNHQILAAFESNYEQKTYHVAYALGLQFVETALLEIPKHGYFYSKRHERERMQSALDAVRVTQLLQEMEEKDALAGGSTEKHNNRVQQLSSLALQQVQEASNDQYVSSYESHRAETEAELRKLPDDELVLCEPLLTCGEGISGLVFSQPMEHSEPPVATVRLDEDSEEYYDTMAYSSEFQQVEEPPMRRSQTLPAKALAPPNDSWTSQMSPPPLFRSGVSAFSSGFETDHQQPQTSSLSRVVSTEDQLERALYLSGLEVSLPEGQTPPFARHHRHHPEDSDRLTLATLCDLFREDFHALCSSGRVRISYADTYQGRLPESTNGCTVIAPLLCIHHLLDNQIPDPGLADVSVAQVIDQETPVVLKQLRKELGLSEQAFLIPSDAHDYLIENGQLSQRQFVNVLGGNILDEGHLTAFVNALRDTDNCGKLAATLFIHEHVIAILQVRRGKGKLWYDIIDSLPLKETMMRKEETDEEFHRRLGLMYTHEERENAFLPMSSRIRCLDTEALLAVLKWYACSKFTDENASYIDQYEWDEASCDFDPRVFQAFIWSAAPS